MRAYHTVFFFLLSLASFSQVAINCRNQSYSGQELKFYEYADPVSLETILLFTLNFNNIGQSSAKVETSVTRFAFCDFGVYRGLLFVEPHQNIVLQLPPLREKSFADQKNPYFEPVKFWFATENKQQLNNLVVAFTTRFNQLTDNYFDRLYFRQSKQVYDSLMFFIEKEFGGNKPETFTVHKNLSLKMVETEALRLKPEDYAAQLATVKQDFWLHPAFIELFDKTFTNQLSFEVKTLKGAETRKAVNQGNISFLTDFVKKKFKLTGDFATLALLKMLHDAWYSGDFLKKSIVQMIQSATFMGHQNPLIRTTAGNIAKKITFLQAGTEAPVICLKDLKGQNACTNQNKIKYKYIIFADSEMAVCREHLKYLPVIEKKFTGEIEIFIVLRKTDTAQMKKFFAENEVPGIKLVDENSEFINRYKVKSFPQCYLLDQNHKVKITSVKAPLDGFEQQFGAILQQDFLEKQRKSGK